MTHRMNMRQEIDDLRAQFEASRKDSAAAVSTAADKPKEPESTGLEHQMAELNRLVQVMLDDAEETVIEHPVATVAGALALGIVIGRLTAR